MLSGRSAKTVFNSSYALQGNCLGFCSYMNICEREFERKPRHIQTASERSGYPTETAASLKVLLDVLSQKVF